MEHQELFTFSATTVRSMIRSARKSIGKLPGLSSFNELPAAMIFPPAARHSGSLHVMYFPTPCGQRFHYHPGDRCLLLVGDVEVRVQHSEAGVESNPQPSSNTLHLRPLVLHSVRFPAFLWHRFSTVSETGSGVLAFSFHGDDQIEETEVVSPNLMEELTVFLESDED